MTLIVVFLSRKRLMLSTSTVELQAAIPCLTFFESAVARTLTMEKRLRVQRSDSPAHKGRQDKVR